MLNAVIIYILLLFGAGVFSFLPLKSRNGGSRSAVFIALSAICLLGYCVWSVVNGAELTDVAAFPWDFPVGRLTLGIDPVSSLFAVPLLILTSACAFYGSRYFKPGHQPGISHWLNFALLAGGMMLVLLARNAIVFIIAWEIMSFASFLLVLTDSDNEKVRRSAWIYFITAHIGTAFLLLTFFLLAIPAGSFEFADFAKTNYSPLQANLIFISALLAFGMKAGFIPFHVWLPLAHPSAPSHVSGLMSGIMIKMGIYGIMRVLIMLASYHEWWGILLIILGAVSGILGVLFAIGQHEIKSLLAYHSVENIGIILLGMGIGIVGVSSGAPIIAALGFGGALLHVINHALFKSLLFLGAGSVIRQTGTGDIDQLGGLIKKTPTTASLFLLASAAICGLPFLNGFVSEIMIYGAGVTGAVKGTGIWLPIIAAVTVISLAAIGGLAAACFTKVFGTVFLGVPREKLSSEPEEPPAPMRLGMVLPAIFIVVIGLFSFAVIPLLLTPVKILIPASLQSRVVAKFAYIANFAQTFSIALFIAAGIMVAAYILYIILTGRKKCVRMETWGCGYTEPDPSMQYSASSFAEPLTRVFEIPLDADKNSEFSDEIFPQQSWKFSSHVNDWILNRIYIPFTRVLHFVMSGLHWVQCGKAGVYVVYIIATLFAFIIWMLLVWK